MTTAKHFIAKGITRSANFIIEFMLSTIYWSTWGCNGHILTS